MRTTSLTLTLTALWMGLLAGSAQAQKADAISDESRKAALQHYQAGMAKMQAQSFAEAAEEFQSAVKLDRLLVLAHYQLGEAQMGLANYPRAVEALESCIAVHKELMALQSSDRDQSQKRLDEQIEALKDSQRHLAMNAGASSQPQNTALQLESRLHELEQQRRRGTVSTEVPAEFSLALGSAYLRAGRMDDAEKAYGEAIKVNAKMGEAHNNLAFVFFRSGRLDQAEAELKAAEKSGFPVNPRFKDDLQKAKKGAAAKP